MNHVSSTFLIFILTHSLLRFVYLLVILLRHGSKAMYSSSSTFNPLSANPKNSLWYLLYFQSFEIYFDYEVEHDLLL